MTEFDAIVLTIILLVSLVVLYFQHGQMAG